MSRRKQSKPRQIKRSLGDPDGGEENTPDDHSLSGEEGGVSDPDDSAECDSSSPRPITPVHNEESRTHVIQNGPPDDGGQEEEGDEKTRTHITGEEEEEEGEERAGSEDEALPWHGPDYLDLCETGSDVRVVARRDVRSHTIWGPFLGTLQSEDSIESPGLNVVCADAGCWLNQVPLTSDTKAANCIIYRKGEELYCKVTKEVLAGDDLLACPLPDSCSSSSPLGRLSPPLSLTSPAVKEEPALPPALRSGIQLLPQQAGMAAILATAVVNKDIFPCKDCGIWYRSERNLQAHLMYYCASRQKQPAAAPSTPPEDKAKETYPNERVCPFPQCSKSCPSASSLEIHMRTHSGERPFVCLVCLSAFTTKANCERHLKVHTDLLSGMCHGCGFVSTTRDILYSHLVTSHMACQPGARADAYSPKLPLAAGLSPGDSGVVLKCQVCGHNCDSPAQLQQHVRTHLEVRVPAERSPTPRQMPTALASGAQQGPPHPQQPPQPSLQDGTGEPPGCIPRPDSSSPGAAGGSATPGAVPPPPPGLRIKEEPRSDSEAEGEDEEDGKGSRRKADRRAAPASSSSSRASASPRSPSAAVVKTEPASPTPGSSPAHPGGAGSVLPGAMGSFLPQYPAVFSSPEAAILPQASEILAKMSEMVHSRLKQGVAAAQNGPAAGFYPPAGAAPGPGALAATPPPKGATCFECDITFNNVNNYYVHKRLYCSSRHQAEAASRELGGPATVLPAVGQASSLAASPRGAGRAASASPASSDPPPSEVKTEPGGAARELGVSSSSEGEGGASSAGGGGGGGGGSEGSQSPASGSAAEDPAEDDPARTFCEACNIRFSRHDNYTVHKRFYCASRHDPSNQRSGAGGGHPPKAMAAGPAFLPQQPFRTRKRKKMYEIHMARTEALAAAGASVPCPSALGLPVKQELPLTEEGDGPIDLSKRPRLQEAPQGNPASSGAGLLPALPLSDYHKCTACSISFNSIENYLAHKAYYCPATTLQPHTLEQLQRLKRPASTSPKSRPPPPPPPVSQDLLLHLHGDAKPAEWQAQAPGTAPSASPRPSDGSPPVAGACPYCPGRPAGGDLLGHLKSAHGLLLHLPSPPDGPPSSSTSPPGGYSPASASSTSPSSQPPRLSPGARRDSVNGRVIKREAPPSPPSPAVNGSPQSEGSSGLGRSPLPCHGSPLVVSPSRALSLTVSPVPEALLGGASLLDKASLAGASASQPHPPAAKAPAGGAAPTPPPVQNGNSRFCRLCNIKFSSLSTFIAHKKYYCSSHSAEHVK